VQIFTVSPAILPTLSGWSPKKFSDLYASFMSQKMDLQMYCELGNFGMTAQEFDLYTDIADAGANYQKYFSLKFQIPIASLSSTQQLNKTKDLIEHVLPYIEIQLFDEMIAIATQTVSIDIDRAFEKFDGDRSLFDTYFVNYISQLTRLALAKVNAVITGLHKNSQIEMGTAIDLMKPETLTTPSIGWVHKVFIPTASELEAIRTKSPLIQGVVAPLTLDCWDGHHDYFGWGDSIVSSSMKDGWHVGCVLSQYFYFVLDRFNRRIPNLIGRLRSGHASNSLSATREIGMNLRHRVAEKEIAYADALHGIASNSRIPMQAYDNTWRFKDLRANLAAKLPILQDVLNEVQDKAQRRASTALEALLFFVSIMSLVGMFLTAHDYVTKPPKDKASSYSVLIAMQPGHWADVLSLAVGAALFGLIIFAGIRFGLIQKAFRLFMSQVRKIIKN
jgi:hypothetical protein